MADDRNGIAQILDELKLEKKVDIDKEITVNDG
jgi:hypothetical protein